MPLQLYAHPFSSYCQKVLIALYENDLAFDYVNLETAGAHEQRLALWPVGLFPVLRDGDRTVVESSIIIEYLGLTHPGPCRLVPASAEEALDVRFMDRVFDNHVMAAVQRPVIEALRYDRTRLDAILVEARAALETVYAWLDARLAGRKWAAGAAFSLADCAAAPALFYADWVHLIGPAFPTLRRYRTRLLARPSFARVVDEARPYRAYFPLGAPDRD